MERRTTVLLIASALLAAGLVIALWPRPGTPPQPAAGGGELPNVLNERERWLRRIEEVGVERAYGEFKLAYAARDPRYQHLMSHLMGALIYERLGAAGITACDDGFGDFGCYHGFAARAVSEGGAETVRSAIVACREFAAPALAVSCEHGVGHGLIEVLGHHRLSDALALCEEAAPQPNPFAGCTVGVFMEYNGTPSATTTAAVSPRPLDPNNPYEPCPTLPERFRQTCYYQLPQWWNRAPGATYQRTGQWCGAAAVSAEREACFRGVGSIAATLSGFDPAATIRACRTMPNAEGEAFCRAMASLRFSAIPALREQATTLCEGLADELRRLCAPPRN